MKRLVYVALALCLLMPRATPAQTSAIDSAAAPDTTSAGPAELTTKLAWTAPFDGGDVKWVRSTMSGVVIAATEEGLFGLDDSTGKILWKKVDLREPDNIDVNVLPTAPYAFLRLEKGQRGKVVRILFDITTGRELWDSAGLGFLDVWQQVFVPRFGLMVMAGKLSQGDPDKVVMAVGLETGQRAWLLEVEKKEAEHVFGEGPVFFDSDSTLVATGERMTRFDMHTGKRLWQSPKFEATIPKRCAGVMGAEPDASKSRPLPPVAHPRLSRDGRFVFIAYGDGIAGYDKQTGVPLWKEPAGLCGRCVYMRETDYGLLVHTKHGTRSDELVMLDIADGGVIWQCTSDDEIKNQGSIKKNLSMLLKATESGAMVGEFAVTNPILIDRTAYFLSGSFAKREIKKLDIASGTSQILTPVKQSADYEPAVQLVTTRDGLLAIGVQDLQWFDMTGKSVRRQQYDAPNDLGLGLLMLGGIKIARSIGAVEIGDVDVEVGGSYQAALDRMMREYHATSAMNGLVFMLSGNDPEVHGIALLGINRGTGAIVARIPTSKEPRFVADVLHGHVFMLSDDAIQCYACTR